MKAESKKLKNIEFKLSAARATSVGVAGTFNGWDSGKTPLRKDGSGMWKATVLLPPGRHEYRFVVDGQWISDPDARECVGNSFGSTNSVLVI